jgi:membrane fusion protein (multidrug efflux system)
MPEQSRERTQLSNKTTSIEASQTADGSLSAHSAGAAQAAAESPPDAAAVSSEKQEKQKSSRRKRMLILGLGGLVLVVAVAFGIPSILEALNTVSTDDAYVNGHVTFVAARVRGQVARVLVDDNNRVHRGDLLVELDKEPYRTAVAVKKAAVETAKADLQAATADVRGIEAEARSRRWNLQHAMEDVANREAELRTRVAGVDKAKAALALAQIEFDRAAKLVPTGAISRAEYDRRQAILVTARAELVQALTDVNQTRASLGLKPLSLESPDLGKVPPDLDQTFSSVREAQAALIQSAAQLGVLHSYNQTPKEMLDEFEKSGSGNIDRTFARLAAEAPAVKQAEAKLEAAERDLAQAELDLRYCDVFAAIDGLITRRNVNPGNNVQVGQSLMAIRSLDDIWVDANFKETQLRYLRIGQPVDLHVDMYGSSRIFKGRIAGFTMGTGSSLALLPAQNATGNFVKVVQRLPVRIDLLDYDAGKYPLFIGTSVVPVVHINEPATGPDAGKFLQAYVPRSPAAGSVAGASSPRAGK